MNKVAIFWPTAITLDRIEGPTSLPNELFGAIKDQASDLARRQVIPGQCCSRLPLLALCSWNSKMVHEDASSLRCHRLEGHEDSHVHNRKTEVEIKWRGNLSFDEIDWKAIKEEQLNR
jgi:hypothetical protein